MPISSHCGALRHWCLHAQGPIRQVAAAGGREDPFRKHDDNFALARREATACQPLGPQHRMSMGEAECTGQDVEFPQQDEWQSMLEDGRLRRNREIASRAVTNGEEVSLA